MKNKILNHKGKLVLALLLVVIGVYYYYSKSSTSNVPLYVFEKVEKGSVISAVTGSGQVSSLSQIDIKPKISADILEIKVKTGDKVKTGQVLALLDAKDLESRVRDTRNSLSIAVANLNLKLSGPTKEDLAVSQKSLQSSKLTYDNSVANLENVKRIAEDNLRNKQLALDNAKISLDNAQNSYNNAVSSSGVSGDSSYQSLENAYASAKISINSALVAMRSTLTAVDNILNINNDKVKSLYGVLNTESKIDSLGAFDIAKTQLANFENKYNIVSVNWERSAEENLLNDEIVALESLKTLCRNMYTMLINTIVSSDLSQTTLDGYKSSMSSQESAMNSSLNSVQSSIQSIASAKLSSSSSGISTSGSLSQAKNSLESAKNNLRVAEDNLVQASLDNKKNIDTANQDIKSKKLSYESAQAQYGLKIAKPRDIDLATSRIQVSSAQNTYNQALEDLNNAKITSPIDGEVAKVYQDAGSATVLTTSVSNPIVTVITQKKLALVTLNEVDAAKVKNGQKAMLTFSAIDGLSISGEVVEIDSIGTVSSGVVSYAVKVGFDTQDERIKPQMSVAVSITVAESLNVLIVPNAALKSNQDGTSYVETLDVGNEALNTAGIASAKTPVQKTVEVGLTDEANAEILSGLEQGELIIVKTRSNSTAASPAKTNSPSLFGGGGGVMRGVAR